MVALAAPAVSVRVPRVIPVLVTRVTVPVGTAVPVDALTVTVAVVPLRDRVGVVAVLAGHGAA